MHCPHSCEQDTTLRAGTGEGGEAGQPHTMEYGHTAIVQLDHRWYIPRVARRRVPSPWMTRREDLVFWRARPGVSFQSGGAAQDSAKPPANLSLLSIIMYCYHFRHYSSSASVIIIIIIVGQRSGSRHAVDCYQVLICPATTPSNMTILMLSCPAITPSTVVQ